ncbi:hypothetical protein RO3G_06647 [Rhizopus delemar RA 99-880]|uniref:Uncharacterized protein n=1 Tax=Rhizopus delemar (strain RA 99-880 / ATCC MYA-4621 / FGSC 9543 / NRRL 43880) TaxID=246409 RepID=I1C0G2_RHIO9|nr:hypothetical protein RO3G_06647 [Rhizopus delemar RA 99-880]|eukprot:EIE81942.1 hypothetical protein RO3G_06647 [Rhizopus delemar RA 99-880]
MDPINTWIPRKVVSDGFSSKLWYSLQITCISLKASFSSIKPNPKNALNSFVKSLPRSICLNTDSCNTIAMCYKPVLI